MGWEENKKKHEKEEREFMELMLKFGKGFFSTPNQDIFDHFDLTCSLFKGGEPKKVDVKGVKKSKRKNETPDDLIHWIEEQNVSGETGWLHGKADYFAFQTNTQWVIVEKQKLKNFIDETCPDKKVYPTPEFYRRYRRKNCKPPRFDTIIKVETSELIKISDYVYDRNLKYIDITDLQRENVEYIPKYLISRLNPKTTEN